MKDNEDLARVERECAGADRQDLPQRHNVATSMANFGAKEKPYVGICDGCAQSRDECLCDVDLADVLDCNHPSHPGCRKCEQR